MTRSCFTVLSSILLAFRFHLCVDSMHHVCKWHVGQLPLPACNALSGLAFATLVRC